MSNKKKIVYGVTCVLCLAVIWVTTYFICLQIKPKGDKVVTKQELESMDNQEKIYKSAKIKVDKKEYDLSELTTDKLKGTVVIKVIIDKKEYQGYVSVSDVVKEPQVKLFKDKNYAQVVIPEKADNARSKK